MIFSMLLMVTAVCSKGVVANLLPHLAGFAHYATPENRWGEGVMPLLPDGLVVKDPVVAKGFFVGLGPGGGVPYRAWIGPLCVWGVFLATFYVTLVSLMVIFRRRWMEEERLSFPMAQLPSSLVECEPGGRALLRDGIFWSGFSVPALIGLFNIVHRFIPFIPFINLYYIAFFYPYSTRISVSFCPNFLIFGISYLVSLEILSSILLFTFLSYVQIYLVIAYGSPILGNPGGPHAHYTQLHQGGVGAVIVLVGFGIYEARRHLRDVFRKAFGRAPEVEDEDEMLSYRTAVIGTVVGGAFLCWWLATMGLTWWVVPVFAGSVVVMFTGATRILAEAGVVLQAPLSPAQVLLPSVGTQALGGSTTAGLFLAQPWSFPTRDGPHAMGSASTVLKLTHRGERRSRPFFYVSLLGLVVGGTTAAVTMLHYAYQLGAYGFANSGYVTTTLNFHLNYYGSKIVAPSEGQPVRFLWTGIGAMAMGALILLRKGFYWWPIHPIGYPISTTPSWWWWWINVFVAWVVKRNVLKYGGPPLYGRTRPFFLGLIMGEAVISATRSVVAMLTGRV